VDSSALTDRDDRVERVTGKLSFPPSPICAGPTLSAAVSSSTIVPDADSVPAVAPLRPTIAAPSRSSGSST
jgi:hypothetical protein